MRSVDKGIRIYSLPKDSQRTVAWSTAQPTIEEESNSAFEEYPVESSSIDGENAFGVVGVGNGGGQWHKRHRGSLVAAASALGNSLESNTSNDSNDNGSVLRLGWVASGGGGDDAHRTGKNAIYRSRWKPLPLLLTMWCRPDVGWTTLQGRHFRRMSLIVVPCVPMFAAIVVFTIQLVTSVNVVVKGVNPLTDLVSKATLSSRLIGRLQAESTLLVTCLYRQRRCCEEQNATLSATDDVIEEWNTTVHQLVDVAAPLAAARLKWSSLPCFHGNLTTSFSNSSASFSSVSSDVIAAAASYRELICIVRSQLVSFLFGHTISNGTLPTWSTIVFDQRSRCLLSETDSLLAAGQQQLVGLRFLAAAELQQAPTPVSINRTQFLVNLTEILLSFRSISVEFTRNLAEGCSIDSTAWEIYRSEFIEAEHPRLALDDSGRRLVNYAVAASSLEVFPDDSSVTNATDDWIEAWRNFSQIVEAMMESTTKRLKTDDVDLVWHNSLISIIIYVVILILQAPLIGVISDNAITTVKNMSDFYEQFLSKADALKAEQRRTEDLLAEMLPRTVAKELRAGRIPEAEYYESTTVYFSDVADFNEISSESEPLEVVVLLNTVYNLIDSHIDVYDVYKVETVGSVYVVVSGLPVRNGDRHVSEIADMALDIRSAVSQIIMPRSRGAIRIQLRIGIHTGTCVAGVVGNKRTRYCLFGDTVNTASRMQSTGHPGKIHVSEATYNRLNASQMFELSYRGLIDVKGKGSMTTYWLVRRKLVSPHVDSARPSTSSSSPQFNDLWAVKVANQNGTGSNETGENAS